MSRLQRLRPVLITVMLALACLMGGLATPAYADRGDWGRGPGFWHHPPGYWYRGWRPYPGYIMPAPIYAPPPVVYAPPPPPPGINLVIPFNFR